MHTATHSENITATAAKRRSWRWCADVAQNFTLTQNKARQRRWRKQICKDVVNALLPSDLPGRAIGSGVAGLPILVHGINQFAPEMPQVGAGEPVEAEIALLRAEA